MTLEYKIKAAKKAQRKRLGDKSTLGSKKRCKKGKSCGASCIQSSKVCWVDFPDAMNNSITKTRNSLQKLQAPLARSRVSPPPPSSPSLATQDARVKANDVDNRMLKQGISSERGDKTYNWEISKGVGSKYLGEGSFGVVTKEVDTGNIVKRGEIGKYEAEALEKVGKLDLGPKLIAAQGDGIATYSGSPELILGRVSMTLVPGETIGQKRELDDRIGGQRVVDAYWKARADLHKAGIAHNDMHIENVLVDDKGKGRFVDFGASIISPKAALAEAMGAFAKSDGGDYQVKRWKGTGGQLLEMAINSDSKELPEGDRAPILSRVWQNRAKVLAEMSKDRFTPEGIRQVMEHGIESRASSYRNGVWEVLTDAQAKKYIDILYEGV
jgi:hypothetical protein